MRARWAIMRCNLKVELREVSLKDKPVELISTSKKGTVPVLITRDSKVIDESFGIILWAISMNCSDKLLRETLIANMEGIKLIVYENDNSFKYHLDRYKYPNRYPYSNQNIHKNKALEILYGWNEKIKHSSKSSRKGWLLNNNESIADWCVWPFVRQYRNIDPHSFDQDPNLTYLSSWLNYYLKDKFYEILMEKSKKWEANQEPLYFPNIES